MALTITPLTPANTNRVLAQVLGTANPHKLKQARYHLAYGGVAELTRGGKTSELEMVGDNLIEDPK